YKTQGRPKAPLSADGKHSIENDLARLGRGDPAWYFLPDQIAQVLGRALGQVVALRGQRLGHRRIPERTVDLAVELEDDGPRRAGLGHDGEPGAHPVVLEASLDHRGYVGHARVALVAGHRH